MSITATGNGTTITDDSFDFVMWAIGRRPNTSDLGLAENGVKLDAKTGHIKVDPYQNTSVEGIYAVGDVTGRAELTPVAIAASRKLMDRVFGRISESKLDYDNIPTV